MLMVGDNHNAYYGILKLKLLLKLKLSLAKAAEENGGEGAKEAATKYKSTGQFFFTL